MPLIHYRFPDLLPGAQVRLTNVDHDYTFPLVDPVVDEYGVLDVELHPGNYTASAVLLEWQRASPSRATERLCRRGGDVLVWTKLRHPCEPACDGPLARGVQG